MASGKYYPFRRFRELGYTTSFTYLLQFWLAVFAFSALGFVELGQVVWGWWHMLEMSLLQWVLYVTGSVVVLFCAVLGVYALLRLLVNFWKGWRGQVIRYDHKTVPSEALKAIKPIVNRKDLGEYRNILKKLIAENNKLISEYESVLAQLDNKGG